MNPDLDRLQPYPFQRLAKLFADVAPPPDLPHVDLSIGEPRHPTPALVTAALVAHLDGLASYPATAGSVALREAIARWAERRWKLPALDAAREVLPVNGSREALFAFAQTVIDRTRVPAPVVVMPNPFYQIYEGAARLAGAEPFYVNQTAETGFASDWDVVDAATWARTQLVYVCSPGNTVTWYRPRRWRANAVSSPGTRDHR